MCQVGVGGMLTAAVARKWTSIWPLSPHRVHIGTPTSSMGGNTQIGQWNVKSISIEKQEGKEERERKDASIYGAQGLYIHSSSEPIVLVCMISM